MTSRYLTEEARISAIARCLRRLRNLDGATAIMVALKAEFPLIEVERLFSAAVTVERARRLAMLKRTSHSEIGLQNVAPLYL